jgi:hypothetical protein
LAAYWLSTRPTPWGLNPGFIALLINVVVLVVVSTVTQRRAELAVKGRA